MPAHKGHKKSGGRKKGIPNKAWEDVVAMTDIPLTYDEREAYGCDVCGNVPDESGRIEHGKGCYTQSEDGGGESWVELPTKSGYTPTPWAQAVMLHHPTVRQFVVTGREPAHAIQKHFYWEDAHVTAADYWHLPTAVFDMLIGFMDESRRDGSRRDGTGNRQKCYPTRELALDALYTALAAWDRWSGERQ